MDLSADSLAVILLTSHLALPPDFAPSLLSAREWARLQQQLQQSAFPGFGTLLGLSAEEIRNATSISGELANRIESLLQRTEALQTELERLERHGIWVVTRADEAYPARLTDRLGEVAPAVLCGAGAVTLLGKPGLAVVGSRNVDAAGSALTEWVGFASAQSGLILYSGGARGVDSIAMGAALAAGGKAVGVLADSLEKAVRNPQAQATLEAGLLTLVTPYAPAAGFTVGAAMGRNKIIYALADYGLVIASDLEKGGTWSGAVEALKAGRVPLFVVDGITSAPGNAALLEKGARPFPTAPSLPASELGDWLTANANPAAPETASQYTLF
jgi:DNA processing protein